MRIDVLSCGCAVLFFFSWEFGTLDVLEKGFCVLLCWGCVGVKECDVGVWNLDFGVYVCVVNVLVYVCMMNVCVMCVVLC